MPEAKNISYQNRFHAGEHLLSVLISAGFSPSPELMVMAVPRGGALVAFPIARGFKAPLGLVYLRKLPFPFNPEMGFGVVTHDGQVFLNESLLKENPLPQKAVEKVVNEVKREVKRRWKIYKDASPVSEMDSYEGKRVVLVDDGLATGYSMLGAVELLRKKGPKSLSVAVPTAHSSAYELIKCHCEKLICPHISDASRFAVADAYLDFSDPSDAEVIECLRKCSVQ